MLDDFGTGYSSLEQSAIVSFRPREDRLPVRRPPRRLSVQHEHGRRDDSACVQSRSDHGRGDHRQRSRRGRAQGHGLPLRPGLYFSPPLESANAYEKLRAQQPLEPLQVAQPQGAQPPPHGRRSTKTPRIRSSCAALQDPSEQGTADTSVVRTPPNLSETVIVQAPQDDSGTIVFSTEEIDFRGEEARGRGRGRVAARSIVGGFLRSKAAGTDKSTPSPLLQRSRHYRVRSAPRRCARVP